MAKVQYTEEGYPYIQAGENEPTGDDAANPLYPVVNQNQSQPQSFALPVETPPELIYDPWEAIAARIRARQPVRQASPETIAASEQTLENTPIVSPLLGLKGERYQTWPERLVRSAVSLPKEVMEGKVGENEVVMKPNAFGKFLGIKEPWLVPDPESIIGRAQDVAGMAGGGPLAMKPGTVSLGSGMVRKIGKMT